MSFTKIFTSSVCRDDKKGLCHHVGRIIVPDDQRRHFALNKIKGQSPGLVRGDEGKEIFDRKDGYGPISVHNELDKAKALYNADTYTCFALVRGAW